MSQIIIYAKDDGGVVIVNPSPEYLLTHTIQDVITKDVPSGVPYKIIDDSELPSDLTFRDAWEYQQ